jgi:hypothetical protein
METSELTGEEILYRNKRLILSRTIIIIGYAAITVFISELLLIGFAKVMMLIGISEGIAWFISIMMHVVPTAIAMLLTSRNKKNYNS